MSMGQRIRIARKTAGLSQVELAAQMGVAQSVVSDWENGKLQSWSDVSDRLSEALGLPPGALAENMADPEDVQGIPVVGEVQAGVFRLAVEIPPNDRPALPIISLTGYKGVSQAALKVVGPSMNLLYPEGSFVIVVSAADTDVRDGDRVVVYRSQGELREATIKEVEVEPSGRIALWPRSTHPDHQTPIYLDPGDQDGPEIAYVVVGRFSQEDRPPPPIPPWRLRKRP